MKYIKYPLYFYVYHKTFFSWNVYDNIYFYIYIAWLGLLKNVKYLNPVSLREAAKKFFS